MNKQTLTGKKLHERYKIPALHLKESLQHVVYYYLKGLRTLFSANTNTHMKHMDAHTHRHTHISMHTKVAPTHMYTITGHYLGDSSVQSGPVERPAVLPTGSLHKGCKVGLRDVKPRKPHHIWLPFIHLGGEEGEGEGGRI